MPEYKSWLKQLLEGAENFGPGATGALVGFLIGLLWMVLGLWKTLFILLMTFAGYFLAVRHFSDKESFRKFLDKIFPPGFFR